MSAICTRSAIDTRICNVNMIREGYVITVTLMGRTNQFWYTDRVECDIEGIMQLKTKY